MARNNKTSRKILFTCLFQIILILFLICSTIEGIKAKVIRVIDGDTIEVQIASKTYKVRLIGVDTPETKHPKKEIEYFGEEAYKFTKKHLENEDVILSSDSQTLNKDKYDRLLRYVWIDHELFNAKLIKEGYAHVYTKYPFDYLEDFRKFEKKAREQGKGLWSINTSIEPKSKIDNDKGNIIVCITRTGKKYHRCSCSYLSRSSIPIKLKDAVARGYTPCSRCNPPTLN